MPSLESFIRWRMRELQAFDEIGGLTGFVRCRAASHRAEC
jgi:hypothetical protein